MSTILGPVIFMAAMIAVACTFIGGLYLLFRHEPPPNKKLPKKLIVSNLKLTSAGGNGYVT